MKRTETYKCYAKIAIDNNKTMIEEAKQLMECIDKDTQTIIINTYEMSVDEFIEVTGRLNENLKKYKQLSTMGV